MSPHGPEGAAAPRTLLVTGHGGAGRSTVATATAVAAARSGVRTVLLTGDRADIAALLPLAPAPEAAGPLSGSAALGRPEAVDGVPHLRVAAVDTAASFRAATLDLQQRIGTLLDLLGAAPLDPEELTDVPGADALALLRALRDVHTVGHDDRPPWDLVVVDLPPVREAVALLALPEQLRRYLRRLLPADRQAARALRPVLAQLAGVPMPAEWAYEAAARADRELSAVQAVIEHTGTSVALVVEPGPRAERVLTDARAGLALFGHRLTAVAANRLLPTGSADPFLAGLAARQQDHLKAVAEPCAADGVALRELPHLGAEPYGAAELAPLALDPGVPEEGADGVRPDPWTVEDLLADEGHFVWSLPLPGASRDGLDLVRHGDELVVDAGGFRRIVPLPSALRRCTVSGAALRDGALRVRFTPDPALWPR
ncbi:arsenite efflux ATP-binding protein ArsA [Actinacidiphila alni]|uniref:Arsenite efflux ATP-binding protein ArsA n=1 Tax=Actinacidiphila alni TaxID=380248 RepID=A0A1I2GV60_9ACTN|nr:ArsA-related P-loop ATPase [Actinacidiphila alni]SFF20959.1 arsenite efflux ATP-binding protein ArsA [Actinacidiphila alni]